MKRCAHVSRRMVLAGLLAAPSAAASAPLIDLTKGTGIFALDNNQGRPTGFQSLYTQDPAISAQPPNTLEPASPLNPFETGLRLNLRNANIDEQMSLSVPPTLQLSALDRQRLNHFLRDWRENETVQMDDQVLQYLFLICAEHNMHGSALDVLIASGYRSTKTNELLRQRSREVAVNSWHTQGKAIDFYLPGVSNRQLGAKARDICTGGVGVYSNFVHIDSGARRQWGA
ncbi:DUF882 domain-containing protein [Roseicyclus sp.]|uniref:YcbK family protein n=1 Tax=Roseicyclus sp. TaxID=1914329 RepID=UPI001BCBF41F|nr:DUF882 domain-containing protein [Roseicyclus sp.]